MRLLGNHSINNHEGDTVSESVIGSYVYHGGKCWNVSTINRVCSSPYAPTMYYETLVWECDPSTKKRGRMVHQDEGFHAHFNICREIILSGAFWINTDERDESPNT